MMIVIALKSNTFHYIIFSSLQETSENRPPSQTHQTISKSFSDSSNCCQIFLSSDASHCWTNQEESCSCTDSLALLNWKEVGCLVWIMIVTDGALQQSRNIWTQFADHAGERIREQSTRKFSVRLSWGRRLSVWPETIFQEKGETNHGAAVDDQTFYWFTQLVKLSENCRWRQVSEKNSENMLTASVHARGDCHSAAVSCPVDE